MAAGFRGPDAVLAGQCPHPLSADELLEAAGGASVHPGVEHAGHRQVADLTCAAVGSGADRAVQHDAETDAAVQPEQGIVGPVPRGAQ
jgi:hypothetical protein